MRRFAFLLPVLLLFVSACSDSSTSPDDGTPAVVSFTVDPTTQVGGGVVTVVGFDAPREDALRRARIAGMDATVIESDGERIRLAVPSFHDGTDFAPPAGPVDLEILDDGVVVARAESALTVTAPAPAPDASFRMTTALGSLTRDVSDAALALIDGPGTEEGFALALRAAIDSLVTGRGSTSLRGRLEALDDEQLSILDRLVASSGVLAASERAAERARVLATAMPSASPSRTTELPESELAARMQLQVMLADFGTDFLNESNGDLGAVMLGLTGVGLTTGITAPGQAVLGTVATVLGLVNFAVNNVVLGYLPARVDVFELMVAEAFVSPGEVPETNLRIVASNDPPAITVLDLVDLVLGALGIAAGTPEAEDVVDVVNGVWNSVLDIVRNRLGAYAASHPDADVAFDVASIPSMTWSTTVTDSRFAAPLTFTPDVIGPAENDILAWRAAVDGHGEGRIYARIQSGPDVTSLPQIPGYAYTAGAFGRDVLQTEEVTVRVAAPLFVIASMDPAISPGGINGLGVRVGTISATGDSLALEGASVQCTADGGTLDPSSGVTGPEGRFDTRVTLDPGSVGVTVDVVVGDSVGQTVTTTTGATTEEQIVATISLPERVGFDEDVPVVVTAQLLTQSGFVPAEGASISLYDETGSIVGPSDGVADAEGVFTSTVKLDDPENELAISAEVDYATLDGVEVEARALREDSVEIIVTRVTGYSEVFATWTPVDGQPNERFVEEFQIEEFDEVTGSVTSSTSVTGSGSRGGMTVNGSSSADVTVRIDTDGSGSFRSLTFDGSTETTLTLLNPPARPYQVQSEAAIEVELDIAVWGTAASWSFNGSSSTSAVDVEIEGDDDLLDCFSETGGCSSPSGSGPLPVGDYDVDVYLGDDTFFSERPETADQGTQSESGTFSFTFTARH